MDEHRIIQLYWARDEAALVQTEERFGRLLYHIAWQILPDHQLCEECVSDSYLRAWESIPPERPRSLVAYLGRIVRNVALNRWRAERAQKRFHPEDVQLGELVDCLPSSSDTAAVAELRVVTDALNRWLGTLSAKDRILFVRRYWFGDAVKDLAASVGMRPKPLASKLYRLRVQLAEFLEKEELGI